MVRTTNPFHHIFVVTVLVSLCCTKLVLAQGTTFTYQGKLTDAGNPANGNYDLQFKLFDALSSGAQQGATLVRNPVTVSAGVFTVTLDFGANVFTGATRYLEIGVRPAGSGSAYTILSPRQPITSSPYAIQTLNAQQLGGLPASGFVQNTTTPQAGANFNIGGSGLIGGNLGIGTATPAGRLHVHSSGNVAPIFLSTGSGTEGPGSFRLQADSGLGGQGKSFVIYDDIAAQYRMVINGAGNMGIGTPTPFGRFNVHHPGNVSAFVLSTGSGTEGAGRFRIQADSGLVGQGRSLVIYDDIAAQYRMVINGSGNVGIGTTAPNAKLFVQGEAANGVGIAATGNASQSLNKGGWVKAMVYVNELGSIIRCYNGLTGSSSGNCGFSVTVNSPNTTFTSYTVNFGFQVNDRFVAVTSAPSADGNAAAAFLFDANPNQLHVFNQTTGLSAGSTDAFFMVIVF
jgi:hypothetical protein